MTHAQKFQESFEGFAVRGFVTNQEFLQYGSLLSWTKFIISKFNL